MNLLELCRETVRYKRVYNNYLNVMYHLRRLEPQVNVVLKTGQEILLPRRIAMTLPYFKKQNYHEDKIGEILNLLELDTISYKSHNIVLHGLRDYGDVGGVFVREEYSFLKVKGKQVIDVGANIGDSSIYFAINDAERVIAIEPDRDLLLFAHRNVVENGLERKIILVNGLYGAEENPAINSSSKQNETSLVETPNSNQKAKSYSLEELLNRFCKDNVVLKMDCEGCEYNILAEQDNILRKFERIQMEFHGNPHSLVTKLKKVGFKVWFERNPAIRKLGYVYAELVN